MMLGVDALDPVVATLLLLVAFVALVVAAALASPPPVKSSQFWLCAGLAVFVFVAFWDRWALT